MSFGVLAAPGKLIAFITRQLSIGFQKLISLD
jgi:hypothetical protein